MPLIRAPAGGDPAPPSDPRAAPALPADIAALKAALDQGGPDQRRSAARTLAGLPGAAGLLAQALAGEADERVREALFTGLAGIGTEEGADLLLPLLRSPDAGLRRGALDALAAMPARLPALLRDADPAVRLLACGLARGLPSGEATALMCTVLEREAEPNVCAAAVDVLAELGEPQALPVLERCAGRLAASAFLVFAVEIAVRRIRAASGPAGEAGA